jgi:hypothetical protein
VGQPLGLAPGLGLLLTFVPLLFPDGRLPSRRWRPVAWLSAIPIVVIPVLTAVALWSWRGPALLDPDGVSQATGALSAVLFPAYVLMLGCGLACLAALLLRFRRARGMERQQLKWLLFACAVTITILLVVQPNTSNEWKLGMLLALPLFPSVPVAAGVAILRYRLYEIDRIINRTLVYGLLTAVLGLGYAVGSLLFVLVAGTGSTPRAGWSPPPPWPRRRYSGRPAAASRPRSIAASTGASTTRPRRSRPSPPACATNSTSIPSPPRCWRSLTRPWSRPRSRFGFDPPPTAPRAQLAVRHGQLPGPTEFIFLQVRPLPARLLKRQDTSATEHQERCVGPGSRMPSVGAAATRSHWMPGVSRKTTKR